jgi:hypothetical protein
LQKGIPGKQRGVVEPYPNARVNVLICHVKVLKTEERSCCFEVSTPDNRTMVFQAENELELLDWVRVFENAKSHALLKTTPAASISLSSSTSLSGSNVPSSSAASIVTPVEEKENLSSTFPIDTIEEEPGAALIEYPNKELKELSKYVRNVLLVSVPFNFMNNESFMEKEDGRSKGGRLYITDKEIILSAYSFSAEESDMIKIPWSQITEIKVEKEVPSLLYPRLIIKQIDQPELNLTILAQSEDLRLLEKIHLGIKRFASDPQDLLNRLYRVGGVSLEGDEAEMGDEESRKQISMGDEFDFEVPPEVELPTSQVKPPPVDNSIYDVKELDMRVNLPVQVLFQVLFANERLTSQWHKKRKSRELEVVPWNKLETEGHRILKYNYFLIL